MAGVVGTLETLTVLIQDAGAMRKAHWTQLFSPPPPREPLNTVMETLLYVKVGVGVEFDPRIVSAQASVRFEPEVVWLNVVEVEAPDTVPLSLEASNAIAPDSSHGISREKSSFTEPLSNST
jgi:hypothetical protein